VPSASHATVAELLDARASELVGRERELAVLSRLLEPAGPVVAFVHGVAGAGKSTLARAFTVRARAAGADALLLDGADVEPTARGLHAALEAAGTLSDPSVLVLDAVERLRLVEDWLRRAFIPALPRHVRIVLAGREPPDRAWAAAYGGLLIELPLDNLAAADVDVLLRRLGVSPADVPRVNRVARGHPLALQLMASALAARPDLPLEQVAATAVIDRLAGLYLDGLDPATQRTLDAAALVRRPTRPLLRSLLPDGDPEDAFGRLVKLPFARLDTDGIVIHDTVRDVVDARLRAADPERRRALRAAAYRHLRKELGGAAPGDLWRATADMLFMIDNPRIRDGFFPPAEQRVVIEPAQPGDRAAVAAMAEAHTPPGVAALLTDWFDAAPAAFRIARDRRTESVGAIALCEPHAAPVRLLNRDPVAAAWRADLRRRPVGRNERVVFVRWLLDRDHGEGPSAVQAALWLDAKRAYMELRPELRRLYTVFRRPEVFAELLAPLGFTALEGPGVAIGEATYHSRVLDFGPRSVDGWLAALVVGELEIADEPLLDVAGRQLRLGERRIGLTELEVALLGYLIEREGQVVSRTALRSEVWDDAWQGGSNVVDVAISGLRRKLADSASMIETVRGVGYRLRLPPPRGSSAGPPSRAA
jgi:hypothetical protein